ncbi:alpha/beta hydrolase [Sorangium sp. So ce1036]|uniref:alpha/beta fold hydrolase n=1 Tax=Sorangium sp. So ce1036 TaxID=3133328 RepID=UPI003F082086
MARFDLGGCELYFEERGRGRPVVFLHGVWMSGRFFRRQLPYLSASYRAIALDLRAHGRSTEVPSGHTIATYARDLRVFLERLELEGVVLVGWSMGCMVIWDYVKQFGDGRLAAAVLIEQSPSDFRWPDWPLGAFDLPALAEAMARLQTDRDAFARDFISLMFKRPPGDAERQWIFDEITRVQESIAGSILFNQTLQDYRPLLGRLTVPSLVVVGRDEKLVPVAAGEYLARRLPDARLLVFEESGHCPFLEEPDRFNEEVHRFIQSLS